VKILIADIGHYESEQYTRQLLHDMIKNKFGSLDVSLTGLNTNPVKYFI
jgi:putative NIF3 family GTP cyclohydrolase 1 type 2